MSEDSKNKGAKPAPTHPAGELRRAGDPGASHAQLSTLAKRGRATRLAPGLYVVDASLPLEQVVRHHATKIISLYWPEAIICARSALAGGVTASESVVYVTPNVPNARTTPLSLPGLTIFPVIGPPHLPGEMSFQDGLFMSGVARGLVENVTVRGRPAAWRAGTVAVEDRIDELARRSGAGRIKTVLDQLDVIESNFDPTPVGEVRERLAAVLGSQSSASSAPVSPRLAARLDGVPFDAHRIQVLTNLVATLTTTSPVVMHAAPPAERWHWLPFFESYLSNFIEGTEFSVLARSFSA